MLSLNLLRRWCRVSGIHWYLMVKGRRGGAGGIETTGRATEQTSLFHGQAFNPLGTVLPCPDLPLLSQMPSGGGEPNPT